MTTINDTEPTLAGDPDAQQGDPEYDVNQDPEIDASDVVAMAQAIQAGVPIQAAAEERQAGLATHTWTSGVACPMRSVNRKVHALTSIYDLKHADNEITPPSSVPDDVAWLARCETHGADFYSRTFAPAWQARNRPWTFCPECEAIFAQRYGKGALAKAVKKGKKVNTVAVAPPKPKAEPKPKKAKAVEQVEAVSAQAAADAWLDSQLEAQDAALDVAAPAAVNDADPEEAVWNEWSAKLSKQAPAGGVIDWLGEYHYRVYLPDARSIEVRVHLNEATFKHTDAKGRDHYTDSLPAMLADIG